MVVKPEDLEKKLFSLNEDDLDELKELEIDADRILTRYYAGSSVYFKIPPIEKSALRDEFEKLYKPYWEVTLQSKGSDGDDYHFSPKRKNKRKKK